MAGRKIEVIITGDSKGLEKAFASSSKSASKFGSSMAKAGKLAAVGLAGLGVGAVIAGKKMISMASDAAEVQSKLEVVFGKTLPKLTKEIDKFSEATGTSRFAMREQAADMGALLRPLTSTQQEASNLSLKFVKLATDLGSFNNVPTEDALLAIRSGLVGEAEPLRRFGVLLNEAAVKAEGLRLKLVKGKEEMTEQQKVQARASLIMQQTTLAQGDATRTAGSFANQLKALKSQVSDTATSIGISLLPMATKVLGALNDAAGGVRKFVDDFKKAKGLEAKVQVVLERGRDLMGKIGVIAQDIGKQLAVSLGAVNWSAAGIKIASGIGTALEKGLPIAGKLAATIGAGIVAGVNSVDWIKVGQAMAAGLKKGAVDGIKNFAKDPAALAKVYSTVLLGVGVTKLVAKAAGVGGERVGQEFALGSAGGIERYAPKVKGASTRMVQDAAQQALAGAYSSGAQIGANFGQGVGAGIASQLSYAAGQAEHLVLVAIQSARNAQQSKSPSKVMMQVGRDFAQGYTEGMDGGLAQFGPRLQKRIQAAVARAQAVIDAARSRFQASFSVLSDKLLRAFDAESGGFRTKSETELDAINARRRGEDLASGVADAQRGLDEARAGGDQNAIVAAQRTLDRALEDVRIDGLETQAAIERKAYEDEREAQRERLDERLRKLGEHFEKEGTTIKKAMREINKIMRAFGITFAESGALVGNQFVKGLIGAIGGAAAAGAGVRGAQTGGNPRPDAPGSAIVTQVVLDGKVVAESVRRNNVVYQTANAGVRAI